jgi:hypothetical protein
MLRGGCIAMSICHTLLSVSGGLVLLQSSAATRQHQRFLKAQSCWHSSHILAAIDGWW